MVYTNIVDSWLVLLDWSTRSGKIYVPRLVPVMSQPDPPVGVYRNKQLEYFSWNAVSSSDLKKLAVSPANYKRSKSTPEKLTPALRIGRLFHEAVFGDELDWIQRFSEAKRTLKGKTLAKDLEEWKIADSMAKAFVANPQSLAFLSRTKIQDRELAIVFEDPQTGVLCKALIDAPMPIVVGGLTRTLIWDLKSTQDASDEGCQKAFVDYEYFIQAAQYMVAAEAAGLDPCEFHFAFVEKKTPFEVNWLKVSDEALNDGKQLRYKLLRKYQECQEKGVWNGFWQRDRVKELSLPHWKRKQLHLI